MRAYFFADTPKLTWDTETARWELMGSGLVSHRMAQRYIRTRYNNEERFVAGFVTPIREIISKCPEVPANLITLIDQLVTEYRETPPYTYSEAFALEGDVFRSMVFGCIRVPEMIRELGHTRIATAGRAVRHKQFAPDGEFTGYRDYDVVFETHRVNGAKLGLRDDIYAVRCWCTTTHNEHWLWIQDEWRNDPLEAIAHTFQVHENLVPYIKELKRQGDVLLVELTESIEPRGQLVTLTTEQYFGLLTAQS